MEEEEEITNYEEQIIFLKGKASTDAVEYDPFFRD